MVLWLLVGCLRAGKDGDTTGDTVDTPAEGVDTVVTEESDVPAPSERLRVRITAWPEEPVPEGDGELVRGRVTSSRFAVGELTLAWSSDRDGPLAGLTPDPATGEFAWSVAGLTPGRHLLTLLATSPDGGRDEAQVEVAVCSWPPAYTFDSGIGTGEWRLYGHATWDPGGWIEVTGNQTDRKGAIYRVSRKINPGDLRMEFRIATGGGSGADGFSVNIINAPDVPALENLVALGRAGGCLAYGTDNGYCGTTPMSAFHVEFDTWYNGEAQLQDPTRDNHVEITLNGDPGAHYAWVAVPSLEDLVWRHVAVRTRGSRVTAWIDGAVVIDQQIPGFSFDGGYVGVSGSTGAYTNYHRFDDLRLYDECVVPEE